MTECNLCGINVSDEYQLHHAAYDHGVSWNICFEVKDVL
jgi:hypothetical protein